MNKKILFTSAVAAAALTACSSEDALEQVQGAVDQPAAAVVGHDLVAKGLSVELSNDEAVTRIKDGKWEVTDKLGLAWVIQGTDPKALQDFSSYGIYGGSEIYANNILAPNAELTKFETKANIYQGSYFVYYPWEYMPSVAAKTIQFDGYELEADSYVNAKTTVPFISGTQWVDAASAPVDGNVEAKFITGPMANLLKVNLTPEGNISKALGKYNITRVDLLASQPAFIPSVEIDPDNLPKQEDYTDVKDLKAALDVAAVDMIDPTTAKTTNTTIVKSNAYTLDKAQDIAVYVAPTEPSLSLADVHSTIWSAAKVYFGDESGDLGYFYMDALDADETNQDTELKLSQILTYEGGYNAVTLTKIVRAKSGNQAAVVLPYVLNNKNLTVTLFDEISNLDEWNAAVELFDALHEGETDAEATFNVDGLVEFVNEIPVPATAAKVNVKAVGHAGSATFAGKGEMPESLKGAAYSGDNLVITVLNQSELTVASNSEVSTVGNIAFGTTAAATADDPATELNETVPGRIIITSSAAMVNTEAGNNGEIIVEQDAVVPNTAGDNVVRPQIYNAAAGEIIYHITSNLEDKVGTTAGAYTKAMFDASLPMNNATILYVDGATLTLNASSADISGVDLALTNGTVTSEANVYVQAIASEGTSAINAANVDAAGVVVDGALTVTIKAGTAFRAATEIWGADKEGNTMTVKGSGTVKGEKKQSTDQKIVVTIDGDVTNAMS